MNLNKKLKMIQGMGVLDKISEYATKINEKLREYRPARAINTYLKDQGYKDQLE